ncbi:MAG: hypothetical protein P4L38_12435 [Syntrophaceae bacterium]|nr:hypothetical protein [Syntrophaceae bacterium]
MKHVILGLVSSVTLFASIVYGADCRISEGTMGFRDLEAAAIGQAVEMYKQATGDAGPQRKTGYKLLAEGRLVDLNKGEKAELLKTDQLNGESVIQIKIDGKGVMWIMGIDLECH